MVYTGCFLHDKLLVAFLIHILLVFTFLYSSPIFRGKLQVTLTMRRGKTSQYAYGHFLGNLECKIKALVLYSH